MLFPIYGKIKNVPNHQPDTAKLPSIWSNIFPRKSRQIARQTEMITVDIDYLVVHPT